MPPKKDKGKGKKEKKAPAVPEYVPEKALTENDKRFYMAQIELLEKQFEKYQQRCGELKIRQQAELDQVKSLEQDFEMLKHAKKQVELKEEEIADLKDRLVGLGQAKELDKEMLQKKLNELKNQIHDIREHYEAINSDLRNQVADLEIFRAKQESYLMQRQNQQETLKNREEEHVRKLAEIQQKDQSDRDRLKKEMVQKMNHVAGDFRRASNKQMAETTKRTINENSRIEQTITDMEDISTRVQGENKNITDSNQSIVKSIRHLKKEEQQHAFEYATSAELIQMLAAKLQNQQDMIIEKQSEVSEMDSAEQRMKELRALVFNHEKMNPEIQRENNELVQKLNRLDQYVNEKALEKELVLRNLRRAVGLITETLKIKGNESDASSSAQFAVPESTGNLFVELKEILTSNNVEQEVESSPADESPPIKLQFRDPGKRRDNLSYSIGDLGLVPRRDAVLLTNFDKMQQIYPLRERDTIRRAPTKSVAVQTPGLARGSFSSETSIQRLAPYESQVNPEVRDQFDRPNFGPRPRVPRGLGATNRVVQYLF